MVRSPELETAMDRTEKAAAVEMLKGVFNEAGAVVVAHYSGMTVADMTGLRASLAETGGTAKVVKNRLAKIALDGKGGEEAQGLFTGPTLIAFSPDPAAAAKAAVDYAKKNEKFIVLGGIMGDKALDEAAVKALAELPSLDQLRGKLIGLIQAPATKIAGVLQAPAGQLARLISAHAEKEKEAA